MSGDGGGFFVTLDGPGGSGKSTTARVLRQALIDRGYRAHLTTQPSHEQLGTIARYRTDTYRGQALACLVAADRYHHLATHIRYNVDAGKIVICDRYVPSSYVLQRMDGVPIEFIEAVNSAADIPDLAVILTVSPDVAARRIENRGAHSRFESGLETSRMEAHLYRETTDRLTTHGYPLLTLDTSNTSPAATAEAIADEIATRSGLPPHGSTTA